MAKKAGSGSGGTKVPQPSTPKTGGSHTGSTGARAAKVPQPSTPRTGRSHTGSTGTRKK